MQIDFISDTVCPWCFIGKRRLSRAMAMRPNIPFKRPSPSLPRRARPCPRLGWGGKAYMEAKFGKRGGFEEAERVIAAEGAKEGIFFAAPSRRRPDTSRTPIA